MKLTIGMATCGNYAETWFTVQALRLYHRNTDAEILLVDNSDSCTDTKEFVDSWASRDVRLVRYTDKRGTAAAKEQVFLEARGEWVICLDSHVLLAPGAVSAFLAWTDTNPRCQDLLHGPMLYDDLVTVADAMNDEWRGGMWGTWRSGIVHREPYDIPMHGMGLFACRRDAWLHFNPAFEGFGGEEGYIHEKYRRAGRRVLCLPFLKWLHHFRKGAPPYPLNMADRVRNYLIGFKELGMDPKPVLDHFGEVAKSLQGTLS